MARHTPVAVLLQSGRDNRHGFRSLAAKNGRDPKNLNAYSAKAGVSSSGQSKLYENAIERYERPVFFPYCMHISRELDQ